MVNESLTTTAAGALTVNDTSGFDKTAVVQRLNDEMAHLMIPATVYISVLMVLGLVGNCMVCYYYGFKTRRTTNSFFIVVLALYDITVCAFCMPTEIADIELFYTFENNVACKILRFVNYLAGIGSILTLIAIATDRFKKICKVTAPQMTMKTAKVIGSVVFGAALLLSWPSLIIYGSIKVNIPTDLDIELKGSDCTSTKDRQYRKYVWAFNIVHFVMFFACSIVLIVLYSIIGKTIYQHQKGMRQYGSGNKTASSSNETSFSTSSARDDSKLEDNHDSNRNTNGQTSDKATESKSQKANREISRKSTVKSKDKCKTIDSETIKLTIIMIVVTVVFIVSFLPYLSLTVWRVYKGKHEAEFLSGGGLVGFKIGSRSFLLNNTLNPWIYGIFNSNFRRFFFGWLHCKRSP
ncbi:probable G-protein coupled receptor No18 [Mercenaria mercenaria]|uniref:probable G-protein coupled receptor No18 n=1 Tax=Mercenaria mercenaria TaxID=6596 RepID=UPI00234FA794|nr:probable G-protein coupled receptor No18 [Mercenaria mercenaria]